MMPDEIRIFESDDVDDAKDWLAGLDDDQAQSTPREWQGGTSASIW